MKMLKLGELFCGAGGIGLGATLGTVGNMSVEHVWATDYDRDACETYQNNLKPKVVICEDIRKLDFLTLKKIGEIDCLTFGFPCNDFSIVGEQKGVSGTFGSLYLYCVKALSIFKPKFFIAENVSGLRNANDGNAFKTILKSFEDEGYILFPHLYKFNQYCVPQKRNRIIIVGIQKEVNLKFYVPSPKPFELCDVSVFNALKNIPKNAPNHEFTKQSNQVVERLKYIKEGQNAFTADLPKHLQMNIKGATISQIYKRLKADEPSYTITGSGGGGTHVYHYKEDRALTNRERARLQSFPDTFIFSGTKESVRKQIGMAVPPKGVGVIFNALLKTIQGIEYPYIERNI